MLILYINIYVILVVLMIAFGTVFVTFEHVDQSLFEHVFC